MDGFPIGMVGAMICLFGAIFLVFQPSKTISAYLNVDGKIEKVVLPLNKTEDISQIQHGCVDGPTCKGDGFKVLLRYSDHRVLSYNFTSYKSGKVLFNKSGTGHIPERDNMDNIQDNITLLFDSGSAPRFVLVKGGDAKEHGISVAPTKSAS